MAPISRPILSVPTYNLGGPNFSWSQQDESKWVKISGAYENSSTNNHWPGAHVKGENYDRGSNWTAWHSSGSPATVYVDHQQRFSGTWYGYRGPLIVHDSNHFDAEDFLNLDLGATSELDLMGLGSTAISRVLPTNPVSDVPTALAELVREGIPGLPRNSLRNFDGPGNPAGGYLGYEFGIKPFLRELQAFGDSVKNAEKIINDYARRSGTKIRRRYDFFPVKETYDVTFDTFGGTRCFLGGVDQSPGLHDFLTSTYGGFPGVRTDTITREKKSWFSGAFTYYLPEVGSGLSSAIDRQYAEARKLFGGLSISTAWNLLPYSWAADWYTNAGDVLRNIEAFSQDGLVMTWGYIMERCDFHVTRKVTGAHFSNLYTADPYFNLPSTVDSNFTVKFMRRRKATPFGFGLDVDGFTARQKAILSALAIQKIF
jgi:hypothetical protein